MEGIKFIIDDIIVYATNFVEHIERLEKLFQRLQTSGLTINKSKCEFLKDQIKVFGVKLTVDGVKSDEDKISVFKNASPPSNIAELRSFLCLCTHLSRFISNFSAKTANLENY